MPVPAQYNFYIDPARCIGCNACVQACSECDTHKGQSMIQLDFIDRSLSPQTVPVICMHCDQPTCAEVCPADAIKRTEDGVVQTARKARCIACNNCVLVCPSQALFFGTREEFERLRPNSQPVDTIRFGAQQVTTKVKMVVPKSFAGNLLQITAPLERGAPSAAPVDPLLANYFEETSL